MSLNFYPVSPDADRTRELARWTLGLAAITFASPAFAADAPRNLFFYGRAQKVPAYTLHCPSGVGDGVFAPDTFILEQSGSFTDPTTFVPPQIGSGNDLFRPGQAAPSEGDNVFIAGRPKGQLASIKGPAIPVSPAGCEISGSSGGYSGDGFSVDNVSGTIANLSVGGPGLLTLDNLTVTGTATFAAIGNARLDYYSLDSGRPVVNFGTQFAPVTQTIAGGKLHASELDLLASTTDPAYPGALRIWANSVDGDHVVVKPTPANGTLNETGVVTVEDGGVLSGRAIEIQTGSFYENGSSPTRLVINRGTLTADKLWVGTNPLGLAPISATGASLEVTRSTLTAKELEVGNFAPGFMTVSGGSKVTVNGNAFIGLAASASGSSLTVSGAGTSWMSNGRITVGADGVGHLQLTDSATLTTTDVAFIGSNPGSTGFAEVSRGATATSDSPSGSNTAALAIGFAAGATGFLTIDGAGSSWTAKQSAVVGYGGKGTLTVSGAGAFNVDGDILRIGRDAGSVGVVTLTDKGSAIGAPNATVYVGYGGDGTLTIDKGAELFAKALQIGGLANGSGRTTVTNGLIGLTDKGASIVIGKEKDSSGVLTLSGPTAHLQAAGSFVIGDAGAGRLTLENGASLNLANTPVTLGASNGGSGKLVIDASAGAGEVKLGKVTVGERGNGVLSLIGDSSGETGLNMAFATITLGVQSGSKGVLSIENAHLDLGADIVGSGIVVGVQGSGEFDIGKNSAVTAQQLTIGQDAGGSHMFNVGSGGVLKIAGDIRLAAGVGAQGELRVVSGGQATAANIISGGHTASATVYVSGSGPSGPAKLTVDGDISFLAANSDLEVRLGAQVKAKRIQFLTDGAKSSTLTVDGAGSQLSYSGSIDLSGVRAEVSNGGASIYDSGVGGLGSSLNRLGSGAALIVSSGGRFETSNVETFGATITAKGDGSVVKMKDFDSIGGQVAISDKATFDAAAVTLSVDDTFDITSGAKATFKSLKNSGAVTLSGDGSTLAIGGAFGQPPISASIGSFDVSAGAKMTVDGSSTLGGALVVTDRGAVAFTNAAQTTFDGGSLSVAHGDVSFSPAFGGAAALSFVNGARLTLNGRNDTSINGLTTLKIDASSSALVAGQALLPVAHSLTLDGTLFTSTGVTAVGTVFAGLASTPTSLRALLYGKENDAIANVFGAPTLIFRQTDGFLAIGYDGFFDGVGHVVGDVLDLGFFHPGHSPGVITIDGNYNQLAGGVLVLSVGPNDYSRLVVSGAANFQGGSIVLESYQGARPTLGTRYSFIQATGGVTGQVDSIVSPFQGVVFSPTFGADGLTAQLLHAPNYFLGSAITRNQQSVARALDALAQGAPTGAAALLANSLTYASQDQIARSFDQLSGEAYASVKGVLLDDSRYARAAALDRLRGAFGGVAAPNMPLLARSPEKTAALATEALPIDLDKLVFWGQGFDAHGSSNGSRAGAAGVSHSATGFFLGFDAPAFHNWRIGAYGGYDHANLSVSARSSSGKSDAFHAGLFAGGQWGAFGLRLGASYSGHDIDIRRSISFAGLSDQPWRRFGAGLYQLFGEAAYGVDAGFLALEPFAGLALTRLHTNGFREFGGVAALATRGGDTDIAFTTLGLRFSKSLSLFEAPLAIGGSAAWRHAMGAVTPLSFASLAGGGDFSVAGAPIDRDAFLVEPGVDLAVMPNASLGVHYVGQFGNRTNSRGVKGAMTVKF
ncbi:autotransporter domain-containing protein [Methylosinus sp. PW1]|uniref:autotransporter domain-containing protein n=1 Tax=Methylosinus sp. PW1 TaxID=107636 RepID=UPI0018DC7789|nr:autotransporter domain-containing protein [Methylosinus sp. PW1]